MTKKLLLPLAIGLLTVGCTMHTATGPSTNGASSASTNTSAGSVNAMHTANAFTFAQRDLEFAPLAESVGKTASEMNLWQNEAVVRRLRQLMGTDFAPMPRSWSAETPLKKFGDFMMLTGCEAARCSENRYVIFMSTSEGLLKVVHIEKDKLREWSRRSIVYLPPLFEDELLAMKSLPGNE